MDGQVRLWCPVCGLTGYTTRPWCFRRCPTCGNVARAVTLCVRTSNGIEPVSFSGRSGRITAAFEGRSATGRTRRQALWKLLRSFRGALSLG